jgi:hypothetical protein
LRYTAAGIPARVGSMTREGMKISLIMLLISPSEDHIDHT